MTPKPCKHPEPRVEGHEHEWERLFREGVAVAARCKECHITPLDWLGEQPIVAAPQAEMDVIREAIRSVTVHSISGHDWDCICDDPHNHGALVDDEEVFEAIRARMGRR